MRLACLAHVNFLLYIYFDVITEQINDDEMMMMRLEMGSHSQIYRQNSHNAKIQDGGGRHLEIS